MKPFNLESAKAGDPVQTKDGNPARIIYFNKATASLLVEKLNNGEIKL